MKKLIPLIFVIGIGCSKDSIKPIDGRWAFPPSEVYSISGEFNITKYGSNYNFSNVIVGDAFYPATMEYSDKNAVLKFQYNETRWIKMDMPLSYDGTHIFFKNVSAHIYDSSLMDHEVDGLYDPKIIATRVP